MLCMRVCIWHVLVEEFEKIMLKNWKLLCSIYSLWKAWNVCTDRPTEQKKKKTEEMPHTPEKKLPTKTKTENIVVVLGEKPQALTHNYQQDIYLHSPHFYFHFLRATENHGKVSKCFKNQQQHLCEASLPLTIHVIKTRTWHKTKRATVKKENQITTKQIKS